MGGTRGGRVPLISRPTEARRAKKCFGDLRPPPLPPSNPSLLFKGVDDRPSYLKVWILLSLGTL